MNAIDLYNCTDYRNGRITYQRIKTKERRIDKAEISIKVEPEYQALVDKYRDPTGKRVFRFYTMYADVNTFSTALNKGLKKVGKLVGVDDLEFYAARHSWATIALNDAGVDKYTVHTSLNHVDDSMRVTDIYIKKIMGSVYIHPVSEHIRLSIRNILPRWKIWVKCLLFLQS